MTENSRFWDGKTQGDAVEAPYNAPTEFAAVLRSLNGAAAQTNQSGVCAGELGQLAGSVAGAVSPVTIASGRAFVHGTWYENTANVSVGIPDPDAGNARYDIIALRKDWAAQTVRIVRIVGTEQAVPVTPALTQTIGDKWDFPLYNVYITDAGVVTLFDVRVYVPYLSTTGIFQLIDDTTLAIAADVITFDIASVQAYRAYMLMLAAQCSDAVNYDQIGLYFTPTDYTKYYFNRIETQPGSSITVVGGGLDGTWYIETGYAAPGNSGQFPLSVMFFNDLRSSTPKSAYILRGTAVNPVSARVGIVSGFYNYAGAVSEINLQCLAAGYTFAAGTRATLYGIV